MTFKLLNQQELVLRTHGIGVVLTTVNEATRMVRGPEMQSCQQQLSSLGKLRASACVAAWVIVWASACVLHG